MADRCEHCRRKTHFIVKCKCDKVLCIQHRDAYDHHCTYDYTKEWKDMLTKQNPVIKKQKIETI